MNDVTYRSDPVSASASIYATLLLGNVFTLNLVIMKNTLEIEGNWNVTKMKLKRYFVKLTDSDLVWIKGRQELMLDKIQNKLGKTKEELHNIISELEVGML